MNIFMCACMALCLHISRSLVSCIKVIAHGDLVGDVLACIRYTPFGGERLAITCRDNAVYMFNGFTYVWHGMSSI